MNTLRHKQSIVVTLILWMLTQKTKILSTQLLKGNRLGIAEIMQQAHLHVFGFMSQDRLMDVMYYLILLAVAISFSETFHLILDILSCF